MESIECSECGRKIPADAALCPYCGTKIGRAGSAVEANAGSEAIKRQEEPEVDPAVRTTGSGTVNEAQGSDSEPHESPQEEGNAQDPQAEERDGHQAEEGLSAAGSPSPKPKPNMKIIAPVAAAVVVVLAVVIIFGVSANSEKQAYNSYIDTLESVKNEMISSGADAESICNDVQSIWQSAIFDDSRSEWDADLRDYYSDDFNVSIGMYYMDGTTSSTVDSIKNAQNSVADKMTKLANPPEGLDQAYDTATELYQEYLNLTNLSISPSGNLQSFRDSFKSADEGFMASYNMLDTQIPERK